MLYSPYTVLVTQNPLRPGNPRQRGGKPSASNHPDYQRAHNQAIRHCPRTPAEVPRIWGTVGSAQKAIFTDAFCISFVWVPTVRRFRKSGNRPPYQENPRQRREKPLASSPADCHRTYNQAIRHCPGTPPLQENLAFRPIHGPPGWLGVTLAPFQRHRKRRDCSFERKCVYGSVWLSPLQLHVSIGIHMHLWRRACARRHACS